MPRTTCVVSHLQRRVLCKTNTIQDQLAASAVLPATTTSLARCGRRAPSPVSPAMVATPPSPSSSSSTRLTLPPRNCVSPAARCSPTCSSLPWAECSTAVARACIPPTRRLGSTCSKVRQALVALKRGPASTRRLSRSTSSSNGGHLANSNRRTAFVMSGCFS